jgi:hypothetical protein
MFYRGDRKDRREQRFLSVFSALSACSPVKQRRASRHRDARRAVCHIRIGPDIYARKIQTRTESPDSRIRRRVSETPRGQQSAELHSRPKRVVHVQVPQLGRSSAFI